MGKGPIPEKILAKRYFSRVENICRDNKVREFYFKLLHRIVVSKRELFTYGIAKHVLCPYCKQTVTGPSEFFQK